MHGGCTVGARWVHGGCTAYAVLACQSRVARISATDARVCGVDGGRGLYGGLYGVLLLDWRVGAQ